MQTTHLNSFFISRILPRTDAVERSRRSEPAWATTLSYSWGRCEPRRMQQGHVRGACALFTCPDRGDSVSQSWGTMGLTRSVPGRQGIATPSIPEVLTRA